MNTLLLYYLYSVYFLNFTLSRIDKIIVSHSGDRTKPGSLRFEVKWEDLTSTYIYINSTIIVLMESYIAIKNTGPFHD